MNLFRQNGHHWVNFTDAAGKRQRKPTGVRVGGTVEEAQAMEEGGKIATRWNLALSDGGRPMKASVIRPNLGQAMERYYAKYWAHQKQAHVIQYTVAILSREVGHWALVDINHDRLETYRDGLRDTDGNAPSTINKKMQCIRKTLKDCVKRGELDKMPDFPQGLQENNEIERYMSPEEERDVFGYLRQMVNVDALKPGTPVEWEYVLQMTTFLLDTGFRFSEAFVFFSNEGRACLPRGLTKSGKPRQVPMTPRARSAASWMLAHPLYREHKAQIEEVLSARPANPKRKATVTKCVWDFFAHRWQKAVKFHKVEDITLHILRHTCASRLVQKGVSLYVVQKWLGHEKIEMTMRYAHLAPGNFSDAVAALATFAPPSNVTPLTREVSTCHATTPIGERSEGQLSRKEA